MEHKPNIIDLEPTRHMKFDLDRRTIIQHARDLRCVSISYSDRLKMDQAHTELIGGHYLELDLSPKNNKKAVLRGPNGEKEISIRSTPQLGTSLLKLQKDGICVGEIISEMKGKEALIALCQHPDFKDNSIYFDYIHDYMETLAEKYKLVEKADFRDDMKKLKNRSDFTYGKNYSHLYKNEIAPVSHKKIRDAVR